MSLLDPSLLQRLRGSKIRVRGAGAAAGIGERRSRNVGAGIEFAEYREYQPGDDLRHVDRHVLARHHRAMVRRFVQEGQLRATILLDCSGSMRVDASKWERAKALASAAAAVGVLGGDQVRLGAWRGRRIEWHPLLRNARALPRGLAWIEGLRSSGVADLPSVAKAVRESTSPGDLLVIVSDWLLEGASFAFSQFAAARVEVVAVQVLARDERTPALSIRHGTSRLVDAETGATLDVRFDAEGERRYAAALQEWTAELQDLIVRSGGRWLSSTSDESLEGVVLGSWRRDGFIS